MAMAEVGFLVITIIICISQMVARLSDKQKDTSSIPDMAEVCEKLFFESNFTLHAFLFQTLD